MPTEDITLAVEDADGNRTEFETPAGLVELLSEGEETPDQVVADVALMGLTGRAHALAHHSEDVDTDLDVETIEERALELFEERFGVTYAEATGHEH